MTTGVINASTHAATATSGRTYRRKVRAYFPASAAASPLPYHSAVRDWASRIPRAPAMMKAGISKMPCGRIAAATKSGEWSRCTISMIAPITIPFRLMMKIVRMPKEAPPRKRRMQASRLFAKSLRNMSTLSLVDICPATSFSNSVMRFWPIAGFCADPSQPIVSVVKKRRNVMMMAFVSAELDINDHPYHVPDARREPDHDHREEDEVPERGVRLFPVHLHDVDRREQDRQFQGEHDERGVGPVDQGRPHHMLFDIVHRGVEVDAVAGCAGVQQLAEEERDVERVGHVLPAQ